MFASTKSLATGFALDRGQEEEEEEAEERKEERSVILLRQQGSFRATAAGGEADADAAIARTGASGDLGYGRCGDVVFFFFEDWLFFLLFPSG